MLENLHKINWEELNHAYGSAKDVPAIIQQLTHEEADIRRQAIGKLNSNIFHQGSRYSASPYALPFLLELFLNKEIQDRSSILNLITHLAIGYDELYYPKGIDTIQLKKLHEAYKTCEDRNRFRWGNLMYLSDVYSYECYLAVNEMIPILVNYLLDDDDAIQRKLIFLLAWFPDHATISVPIIKKRMESLSDEAAIMNSILCLGLLSTSAKKPIDLSILNPYLEHTSFLLQLSAAIALSKDPIEPKLLDILIQNAIKDGWEIRHFKKCIFKSNGDLIGYALSVLHLFGHSQRIVFVDRIIELLKAAENSAISFDISKALFALTRYQGNLLKLPLSEQDVVDLRILKAIAEFGTWEKDERFIRYRLEDLRFYVGGGMR